MKATLKPRLTALVAALAALGLAGANAAVISNAQVRTEPSEVIINSEVVVETEVRGTGDRVAVAAAAAAEDGVKHNVHNVRVFSTGGAVDINGSLDIDALVSNAMSEAFSGGHVSIGKSVKNAPYSAEIVTEKTQTLPDGNQITKRSSTMSYRDSAGRTRQEIRDANGTVKSIQIHDAVDGARTTLVPSSKTATRMVMDKDFSKRIAELKEKARAMAKDGQATIIERGKPGEEIVIKRVERATGDGKTEVREDVNVSVIELGGKPRVTVLSGDPKVTVDGSGTVRTHSERATMLQGPSARAFAGPSGDFAQLGELMRVSPLGMSLGDGKWSSKATKASLGVRDIEGVRAEGKSVSYTIPAGEIGNKNPITVTTETWYSPELQATVYSKFSDPRSGETVYRMSNIKRSEPAASLFTVPDGYTTKEAPGFNYQFRTEKAPEKK